jgi:hypothetical protein
MSVNRIFCGVAHILVHSCDSDHRSRRNERQILYRQKENLTGHQHPSTTEIPIHPAIRYRAHLICIAPIKAYFFKMRLFIAGLVTLAMPNSAWSFVVPQGKFSSATKLSMAEGDEEGPIMNKWSR